MPAKFQAGQSSLESTRNDPTANLPERDHSGEAPELRPSPEAPQVVYDSAPEVNYSSETPVVLLRRHQESIEDEKHKAVSYTYRISRKSLIVSCASLLVLVIVAIAIGVGVGLGTRRGSNSSENSSDAPSNSSSGSASNSPSLNITNAALKNGILNDSSIATITSADGGRQYVIFQDISKQLRFALFSQSAQTWSTDLSLIIPNTTDARELTPLAATLELDPVIGSSSEVLRLYYISLNNTLIGKRYFTNLWASGGNTFLSFANSTAVLGSRTLSVNQIPNTNSSSVIVIFEVNEGRAAIVRGDRDQNGTYERSTDWTWQLLDATTYGLPATSFLEGFGSQASIEALFFNHSGSNPPTVTQVFYGSSAHPLIPEGGATFLSPLRTQQLTTDLVSAVMKTDFTALSLLTVPGTIQNLYWFWVVENRLSTFGSTLPTNRALDSPFPFSRMASANSTDTAFIIYHQVNESHIGQERYDFHAGLWGTTEVAVETA